MSDYSITQDEWAHRLPDLKRAGSELHGPCPLCGGEDRFYVTPTGKAYCRRCLPDGGDPERFKLLLEAVGFKDRESFAGSGNIAVFGKKSRVDSKDRDPPGKQIDTTVNLISRREPEGGPGRGIKTVPQQDGFNVRKTNVYPTPGDLSQNVTSPVDFNRGEPVRDEPPESVTICHTYEPAKQGGIKTEYPYRDADGAIAHTTHRIDFADGRPKKIWQSEGYEGKRLLYDLPALIAHPERPL